MDYDRAIARLPLWMLCVTIAGEPFAFRYAGIAGALGFLAGAVAAHINLRLIERAVNRIIRMAALPGETVKTSSGVRIYIEFIIFAGLAFAILRFTGFNLIAALCGFLVCPVAAVLEIVYELLVLNN